MKLLPSYHVANHMREEMEHMHWTLIAKLDYIIDRQDRLENEIDLIKKRLKLTHKDQLFNDIELMKTEDSFFED